MSDRVIIQDAIGRVSSVPTNAIPKGAKIIRPDVLPGDSAASAEVWTSEVVNPEPEPGKEVDVTPDDADKNVGITPEADTDENPAKESATVTPRKRDK